MTSHDGAAWILLEGLDGRAGKTAIEDAIAVEEENEIRARPAAQRLVQAFIAASCGGEGRAGSSSTTGTPSCRATDGLPSFDPEST